MSQPSRQWRTALFRSSARKTNEEWIAIKFRQPHMLTVGLLLWVFCVSLSAQGAAKPEFKPEAPFSFRANVARPQSYVVHGTWSGLRLPEGAVNLALRSAGARATASSTAPMFDPNGALDGIWTAAGWGKGHGWQSARKHEFPCWFEVRLPHPEEINTLIVQTFPPVARGVNWLGLRDYDLKIEWNGEWVSAGSERGNVDATIIHRLPNIKATAIRFVVNAVNNGSQEDSVYDDDDYARILQVGIYKLSIPVPAVVEDVSARVETGRLGNIAIFRDDIPLLPPNASSPEDLAALFREAGYGVTFLSAKLLCVPEIFNKKNFDVFVQPYGAPFPVDTLLYDFLHEGGHLVALGGQAFTRALMFSPEGKLVDAGYDSGMTTSVVRLAEFSLAYREQLGIFYNGHQRLEDVTYAETAPGQAVLRTHFKVQGQLAGVSAVAMVGERVSLKHGRRLADKGIWPSWVEATREGLALVNGAYNAFPMWDTWGYSQGMTFNWPRSRWIPLVNAFDRFGQLRGTVMSLLVNYDGPYRGSGWVFCGVENANLFSPAHPEFARGLIESLKFLGESSVLHNVDPQWECYRQGEAAKIDAWVDNWASRNRNLSLKISFVPQGSKVAEFEKTTELPLPPGQDLRCTVEWKPPHFSSDLYRVRVTLWEGSRELDLSETGFVVWDPKMIAQGLVPDFRNNYFQINGRPQFLIGARDDGLPLHGQAAENVLEWDREFSALRDFGMQVFSPVWMDLFIPGICWGEPTDPPVPEPLMRMIDAQAQLAQKYRLIYAPCVFFSLKYSAMERPELSRKICEQLGRRYASVPGIMFYIFDDGTSFPKVEDFRQWAEGCVEGFNVTGRRYLVLAEIGSPEDTAIQRYGTEPLTFPSTSDYEYGYPARYRLIDMRAAGKSFHISEFGVQSPVPSGYFYVADPGRPRSAYPEQWPELGNENIYVTEPPMLFSLGAAYLLNWDWRDHHHVTFPWGIINPDGTPKDLAIIYRNSSYFLRHFQPAFQFPSTTVVMPRERLLHDFSPAYVRYLKNVMSVLMEHSVQFAVLDDSDLDRLPSTPQVLVYPDPKYASMAVLSNLEKRVRAGDTLFLSGDFTQPLQPGENRQSSLFERMVGLKWVSERNTSNDILIQPATSKLALLPYQGSPLSRFQADGATILATDPEGAPIMASNTLGSGNVFFSSDISTEGTRRALGAFLQFRDVPSTSISPSKPHRPILELPRADGGRIYTVLAVRPDDEARTSATGPWINKPEEYLVPVGGNRVSLTLGTFGVALFSVRGDYTIDAIEGQGKFAEGKTVIVNSEPHVMIYSLDGEALNASKAIVLFPVGAGKVTLATAPGMNVVELGESDGGKYRSLDNLKVHYEEGQLTFQIDPTESRYFLLITSEANRQHARELMRAALQ